MIGAEDRGEEISPAQRHADALREFGQIGEDTVARCRIDPSDHVVVRRHGPVNVPTTSVLVCATAGVLYLTPTDARRVASAMLTAADEVDGAEPILFAVPDDLGAVS